MTSMRLRIFLYLVLMTTLVWGAAAVIVQLHTRAEVQRVLDKRLMESARMVSSLIGEGQVVPAIRSASPTSPFSGQSQLSCQIWTMGGELVARSNSAPSESLASETEGFSERTVNGEAWRVYSMRVSGSPYLVAIGDSLALREGLVGSVVQGLLWPALIGLLVLGVLIWGALERGLRPVEELTRALAKRGPDDLLPVHPPKGASELKPFAQAVNDLVARLKSARQREREFTSAAAHELRTPLAGIRLQAQVAASTTDAQARKQALLLIQTSVDRTAHLVGNLLTLAREDDRQPMRDHDKQWLCLDDMLAPYRTDKRLRLRNEMSELHVDPARFGVVISNLLSNASAAARSAIEVSIEHTDKGPLLVVEDDGRGVPQDELSKLGQRFYRLPHSPSTGSGLGLSIVSAAVKAHSGHVRFTSSALGGLRVEIIGLDIRSHL